VRDTRRIPDFIPDPSWLDHAACRGKPSYWWLESPPGSLGEKLALNVCWGCTVRVECLDEAFAYGDMFTIRGGMNGDQRFRMRRP